MKRWHWLAFGLLTAASLVAEFIFLADYPKEHWWGYVPAFYILWGFVGCAGIIYISKWIGKLLLQKKEDYYDAL